MSEIRILGYCEECGNTIYENDEAYIDEIGNYFCSVDCVLEHHRIIKVEM